MKATSRAYYVATILVVVFSLFSGLFPQHVFAADLKAGPNDKWLDRVTIMYGGVRYVDNNVFDGNNEHFSTVHRGRDSNDSVCTDRLDVKDQGNWGNLTLTKRKIVEDGVKFKCIDDGDKILVTGFGGVENSKNNVYQVDADHIYMPQYLVSEPKSILGTTAVGTPITKNNGMFTRVSNAACPRGNITAADGVDKGKCVFFAIGDKTAEGAPLSPEDSPSLYINTVDMLQNSKVCKDGVGCGGLANGGAPIVFANRRVGTVPDPLAGYKMDEATTTLEGRGDDGGGQKASCESEGASLSWVFCPIINGLASTVDSIFSDFVEPSLRTDSVDFTNPDDSIYKVWAGFRNIANILLIIAMLVVVFGQTIGGGMIDAYTAKKIIPRIVAAAILLNLSIYLAALAIDVTNVLGRGISGLIYIPFGQQAWHFQMSGTSSGLGLSLMATGIFALWVGGAAVLQFLAVFILLPATLAALGVFVTIILRQGIIVFLVISSPVAFVLYCLPNTEKYFKQWWSLLSKTLLVYPIIMIVFAMTDVLAVTVGNSSVSTNNTSPTGWMTNIVSMILLVLPMFLIPWSFKMAGGAIGSLSGMAQGVSKKATEAIKGNANDPTSLRNATKRNTGAAFTRKRAQFVRSSGIFDSDSKKGRVRKALGGAAAYGDIFAKEAAINRTGSERLEAVSSFGDDTLLNARSAVLADDGKWRTLDGNEVSASAVRKARALYSPLGELQKSASYRLQKTNNASTARAYKRNAGKLKKTYGLTDQEVTGLLTGVGFGRQNERLEFKHSAYGEAGQEEVADFGASIGDYGYLAPTNPKMNKQELNPDTGEMTSKNDTFVDELHGIRGTWATSQMRDTTINHLDKIQGHWEQQYETSQDPAERALLAKRLRKVYETGDSLSPRVNAASGGPTPLDADGKPVEGFGGVSGAAPAVKNAVGQLIDSRNVTVMREVMGAGNTPAPSAPNPPTTAPGPGDRYTYP